MSLSNQYFWGSFETIKHYWDLFGIVSALTVDISPYLGADILPIDNTPVIVILNSAFQFPVFPNNKINFFYYLSY